MTRRSCQPPYPYALKLFQELLDQLAPFRRRIGISSALVNDHDVRTPCRQLSVILFQLLIVGNNDVRTCRNLRCHLCFLLSEEQCPHGAHRMCLRSCRQVEAVPPDRA